MSSASAASCGPTRSKLSCSTASGQLLEEWLEPELIEHVMDGLRKAGLDVPAYLAALTI